MGNFILSLFTKDRYNRSCGIPATTARTKAIRRCGAKPLPAEGRQRRPSLASMHSVAWGTFIRRSLGMSLPVVLQMP